MKTTHRIFSLAGKSLLAASLLAATGMHPLPAQTFPLPATPPSAPLLGEEQLLDLLGPIALYPDAVIALILPASTVPADVVLGARFLNAGAAMNLVDAQPWDDSVKALSRYPDVLLWMNENLEWTSALGEAFLAQPADVMNAIQTLRARARAAGNLVDTPQQTVVVEGPVIRVLPANPEILYIPQYDPQVIFVPAFSPAPLITFGVGFAVGSWLSFDCDWPRRCLYRGPWRGWNGWQRRPPFPAGPQMVNNVVNVVNIDASQAAPWQPSARGQRHFNQRQKNATGNIRFVESPRSSSNRLPAKPLPKPALAKPAARPVAPAARNEIRRDASLPPSSIRPNQEPRVPAAQRAPSLSSRRAERPESLSSPQRPRQAAAPSRQNAPTPRRDTALSVPSPTRETPRVQRTTTLPSRAPQLPQAAPQSPRKPSASQNNSPRGHTLSPRNETSRANRESSQRQNQRPASQQGPKKAETPSRQTFAPSRENSSRAEPQRRANSREMTPSRQLKKSSPPSQPRPQKSADRETKKEARQERAKK